MVEYAFKQSITCQVLLLHAINVRSDYRKVFHPLRWTSVWYVHGYLKIVPNVDGFALERTGYAGFGQRETKGEFVCASWKDWYCGVHIFFTPNHLALVYEVLVVFHLKCGILMLFTAMHLGYILFVCRPTSSPSILRGLYLLTRHELLQTIIINRTSE